MKLQARKFYSSGRDLKQFQMGLKQIPCPHCRSIGLLNLHGYLRGYDDQGSRQKVIRGRRFYCCHRNRRRGCGRTFSILAAGVLKTFIIRAQSFWHFLKNILSGSNKINALRSTGVALSRSSCYRLWNTLRLRQTHIRSRLLRLCPMPEGTAHGSLLETILHLKNTFKDSACPVAAFQSRLQVPFL